MSEKLTPMMRQYRRIKDGISDDVILFFRMGDFYEMFFEDAKRAAPLLDVALTKRNKVPMCGVPFHALDNYLSKLMRAGCKVAICDQVEDASAAKGIVKRAVTRVVTPGTVVESNILESDRHNYLAGISRNDSTYGLAFIDLSTGLFWGEEIETLDTLRDNIRRFGPNECVIPEELSRDAALTALLAETGVNHVSQYEDWPFGFEAAYDCLTRHFQVHSLTGFGCDEAKAIVSTAGGVLHYVREELRRDVKHVRSFRTRSSSDFLLLDEVTCANLDLAPMRAKSPEVTLLKVLDAAKTAMGARKLRDWVLRPLADRSAIAKRHDAVEAFVNDRTLLFELRVAFDRVRDLARLIARISSGSGNARDLVSVGESLGALPDIRELIAGHECSLLAELAGYLDPMPELVKQIAETIIDEPPVQIKEGGIIRDGYDDTLDELREAARHGRKWLAEYQADEQKRTGIKNIKVRHNRVFGYYLEVSKGQLSNVPEEYIRKQTLVNAERFITPELKEYETKILGAQDKSMALEYEIFVKMRDAVVAETKRIQLAADTLAQLDVLAALADRALALRYVRPIMTNDHALIIKEGRHPIVEQMPEAERFVPNDTVLDCKTNQLLIITGPNMAGKSTYIRQVAMIVVMAQMGSFVPAVSAEIGVVDRVFTRVGASDDLARGRSTFMVEMQETANILNNATSRSLIVLDEIGRGTSTFDGISIAWAVAEHLHNNERVKAKTLFATHYHELTDLSLTMDGVKNYNIQVREKNDKIVFLRRIVEGGADKSYGIQVARLAGMPQEVVVRAKEILANLEEGEFAETGKPKIARHRKSKSRQNSAQMDLFG